MFAISNKQNLMVELFCNNILYCIKQKNGYTVKCEEDKADRIYVSDNDTYYMVDDYIVTEGDFSDEQYQSGKWRIFENQAISVPYTEDEIRTKRDELLASCDKTQVLDAPFSKECIAQFKLYRQELRDVPEQDGFPENVVWPDKPEYIKAEPDPVDTAFDELIGGDE